MSEPNDGLFKWDGGRLIRNTTLPPSDRGDILVVGLPPTPPPVDARALLREAADALDKAHGPRASPNADCPRCNLIRRLREAAK